MTQGFTDTVANLEDGEFSRARTGSTVKETLVNISNITDRISYKSHTLADSGKAGLVDTDKPSGLALVIDTDNNTQAAFFITGGGNSVSELGETGTDYGTTEDNDGTTNVYYDSTNSRYELNNESGGEVTYEVIMLRVP